MANGFKVIDKEQLKKNINEIKRVSGNKKICAMVKADAYGHGIENISYVLRKEVDFLGVSNINEALLIRQLNRDIKNLIVGKTLSFEKCIENNISFTIDSFEHFKN
jgi:alanine racemase